MKVACVCACVIVILDIQNNTIVCVAKFDQNI